MRCADQAGLAGLNVYCVNIAPQKWGGFYPPCASFSKCDGIRNAALLSDFELRARIEGRRHVVAEPNLRDSSALTKQNGTRTNRTQSGLQQRSPTLFKRPAAIGDYQLFDRLWQRWRWRLHQLKYEHSYLGCRNGPKTQWIPHLFRYCLRNLSPVPGCG